MPSFFAIHYCVVLPTEDEAKFSPVQGFSHGLLQRSGIFRDILRNAPPTVLELYHPSVKAIQHRIAGEASYVAFPLIAGELDKFSVSPDSPFWVLFTDRESRSEVNAFINRSSIPILTIDSGEKPENAQSPCFTRAALIAHCDSVLASLRENDPNHRLVTMGNLRHNPDQEQRLNIEISLLNHNTTVPNELALLSVGCHHGEIGKPLVGEDDVYISAIVRSADELQRLRAVIPPTKLYAISPPITDLIVTSPGIYQHVRGVRRPQRAESSELFEMLRVLQSQQTYSMLSEAASFRRIMSDPISSALLQVRAAELNAYTSALAVRAASYLCPVLRLPPGVDHVMPSVIRFADSIRGGRTAVSKKTKRLAESLFRDLRERVDNRFVERIDCVEGHIKLISDTPLEWLPIRGLPLMLRHSTSRIPVTPGNLLFGEILPPGPIHLTMRDFEETLVLRSFNSNDPLRDHMKIAIDAYELSNGEKLPARIVDVSNREQLVHELNSFEGAFAVFDGHGSHSKGDDIGKLRLANEVVNLWEIRKEARVPPIFFACACDTHAIGRSHATSGNGLLVSGARAVIASVLPIESKRAAMFVGRLLFRIYELLPVVTGGKTRTGIRWDRVISLLQRMMFASELTFMLAERRRDLKKRIFDAHGASTQIIHTSGTGWYELFIELLTRETGLSTAEIEAMRGEYLPFPETLKYIHLGSPETIVIGPEDIQPEDIADSAQADGQ